MKACIKDGVLTVEYSRSEYDWLIQPSIATQNILQQKGFRFSCAVDELNPEDPPEEVMSWSHGGLC